MADTAITTTPKAEKGSWVENLVARSKAYVEKTTPTSAKPHIKEAGSVARAYFTAAIVAPLLGATDARFGLDHGGVPLDGALAVIGGLTAVGTAGSYPAVSQDARLAGVLGFASLLQRKTKSFLDGKGSRMHGEALSSGGSFKAVGPKNGAAHDLDGDPILKVAAGLFRRKEADAPR
jgi:hypothetical protein